MKEDGRGGRCRCVLTYVLVRGRLVYQCFLFKQQPDERVGGFSCGISGGGADSSTGAETLRLESGWGLRNSTWGQLGTQEQTRKWAEGQWWGGMRRRVCRALLCLVCCSVEGSTEDRRELI